MKSQVFLAFINFSRLVVPLGMPAGIQIKSSALFARYSSLQNDHVCQLRVRCNIKVTPSLMLRSVVKKKQCCLGRQCSLRL